MEKGREMEEIAGERQPERAHGRILALDVGVKRIGLAISDELGWTALGLETLTRARVREDVAQIAATAAGHGATLLLLGLPLNMDGTEGPQAAYVRDFGARLTKRHGLRVEYWDERLSSVAAEEILAEQPGRSRRAKGDLDRVAAALILQSYLDTRAGELDMQAGELDTGAAGPDTSPGELASKAGDPDPSAGKPATHLGNPATRAGQPATRAGQPNTHPGDHP